MKQYIQILDLISDDLSDELVITLYGKSKDNKNVVVNVIGYSPFFYVRIPPGWTETNMKVLFSATSDRRINLPTENVKVNSNDTDYEIKIDYPLQFNNFYGYNHEGGKEKKFEFMKFSFKSYTMMKKCIKSIKKYYEESKDQKYRFDEIRKAFIKLNDEDGEFRFDSNLYESNIHPLLRFIHDSDIQPSGWIQFDYDTSNEVEDNKKIFNCDNQYDNIPFESIERYESSDLSKYVIASFDIECDSSHGDFPAAKKDFKKPAVDIVEHLLNVGYDDSPVMMYKYIKKFMINNIRDKVEEGDNQYIYTKNGCITEEGFIDLFLEKKEDGDIVLEGEDYVSKKYFGEFIELMKDKKRNDAIKKLTKLLSLLKNEKGQLLQVQGDPIIQIGTVFYTYGVEDSYERYILVIGPEDDMDDSEICCDLDNINVWRFKNEKDMMEGWVKLVSEMNPDYITGYNIFGFDFDYMITRVEELYTCNVHCKCSYKWTSHTWNCPTNKFYQLGRLLVKPGNDSFKHHKEKRCKRILKKLGGGKDDDDEKSFMNDTLKYIHMDGRIIFDVQNEVKKGYSLDSYKLDNVASNFIRGKLKRISQHKVEGVRRVYIDTDRKGNLKNGDYISFNIKNNYGDMKYNNGMKYKILNIVYMKKKNIYSIQLDCDKKLNEDELIKSDKNDVLYSEWCLNKDDISPQELFDKHKVKDVVEGPKGRGLIAKYCIMDCELCIHLLLMLDFIPNNIGMSNVCSVPQPYIFLRGQGIKVQSIVTKFAHKQKYKIPTLMGYDEDKSDNSGFEGAIVLEPKTGLYLDDPISVVDYASLYPSSIIEKNISHDTYLGEYEDIKNEEWFKKYDPKTDYNRIKYENFKYVQKEGTSVVDKIKDTDKPEIECVYLRENKKKGIIPMVLSELLSARSATKKLLKKEKDENKKKVLDGFQLSYKLSANSVYGQLGAKTSCLSFKKVAACTTAIGRQKIIDAKKYAFDWAMMPENNWIYNPLKELHTNYEEYYKNLSYEEREKLSLDNNILDVVYGDTDSIFIKFTRKTSKDVELTKLDAVQHCIDCGIEAGKYITGKLKIDSEWSDEYGEYPQDLEYEKTFYPFILISKKRYTGEKYEYKSSEIPKRTSMGLVTKRRDNAPIVKYVFGNMVNRLMNATKVDDVVKWLKDTLDNIVSGREDISMFIISKTLNSYYKNPDSIAHKVLADRMGERDPGNKPKSNDRIPYAFIVTEPKYINIGFKKAYKMEETGKFKIVKKKVKTGEFHTKKEKVPDGYYKNGKQKFKTIDVPNEDRPKYKTIEVQGEPILRKVEVKGEPKFKKEKVLQGERIEHPDYISEKKLSIDYKHYISNQIMNPVKQLLDIAIDPDETTKLFNSYLE
jgi:DNA polymerase elongation subunit (family B)